MLRLVRSLLLALALGLGAGAGAMVVARVLGPRRAPPPDPPSVVTRVREVAQLETLHVSLYKKVTFSPEPTPADSFWGDVVGWLRQTFREPRGKAIVFADAHLGLDLSKLGPDSLWAEGRTAYVALPPVRVEVVLKPGETEIIGSNLDSAETARLFELARTAFEREVAADAALRERARASAERAIRGLLLSVGFDEVRFTDGPRPRT
ncbi:MAG TPA: DUF4230 domain-containing protein [Anaeromyxobacter sp.]|nr:DUF4230 domain-containing protein [Anaeromyxobacter sp.]